MIPPTPSAIVPPHSSAQLLLRLGQPFAEFPRFSILELRRQTDLAGNAVPFSEWLTKRLQIGQPFVIQHFDQLETWDSQFFEIEKLIELSTKKSESLFLLSVISTPQFDVAAETANSQTYPSEIAAQAETSVLPYASSPTLRASLIKSSRTSTLEICNAPKNGKNNVARYCRQKYSGVGGWICFSGYLRALGARS